MATGAAATRARGAKPRARRATPVPKPGPAVPEGSPAVTEEEAAAIPLPLDPSAEDLASQPFAEEDDLPDPVGYETVSLPIFGRKVAVRALPVDELSQLEMLPDIAGWAEAAAKMSQEDGEPIEPTSTEAKVRSAGQWFRYMAQVAHIAVLSGAARKQMDAGSAPPESLCDACGFGHVESLWQVRKTRLLNSVDLRAIFNAAVQAQTLGWVRPLSGASSDSPTSPSPTSGE